MSVQPLNRWFQNLGFDFSKVFPNAGGLSELDRLLKELGARNAASGSVCVEGTTLSQGTIDALNRLFLLAANDPEARAVLAQFIAYGHHKDRCAD